MIELLIDALAAYRLTRLVTADVITQGPRAALIEGAYRRQARRERMTLSERISMPARGMKRADWDDLAIAEGDAAPKLATLITCRWCAGVWVAAGVLAARQLAPRAWSVVARGLAVSAGAALIAGLED